MGRVRRSILRWALMDVLRENLPFRIIWYDNDSAIKLKQVYAANTKNFFCYVESF